jgi:hypothetical protein
VVRHDVIPRGKNKLYFHSYIWNNNNNGRKHLSYEEEEKSCTKGQLQLTRKKQDMQHSSESSILLS